VTEESSGAATGPGGVTGEQLLELTAELVDIPSVSHEERAIADFVESRLREVAAGVLEVARIGDNVCARTRLGLPERLVLAGHIDTVPPNGNERSRREGDVLYGLGSADMKSGDAVFLEIARLVGATGGRGAGGVEGAGLAADLTWIFYVCEEVDRRYSGLPQIEEAAPDWLEADAAVLGEPTGGLVEAGCQGVLRVAVEVKGERAHTARPWMGRNAIHRLGPVLDAVAAYEGRRPVIDGCEYREALQAVSVVGGVANNVVPDAARVVLNHRFAPDRTGDEAFEDVRSLVAGQLVDDSGALDGASIVLEESAAAAAPGLSHPLLAAIVAASGQPARAKLGWTDVSFFAERGVPALNFGPGEPTVAHRRDEHVPLEQLERVFRTLAEVLLTTRSGS
jgi:succinyl-diaminopimelate desuccinylase